ncbi:hypothetical protein SMUDGE_125 [Bacillus phage Smudge]|uniref:Uncharacterized protein n=1 Tax=Bacillus phage Smudge TaxID=1852566 RepID=A0A173H2M3_9CAUD|nr:hypothetical protein SMUDGE_125 [Bacillus phage Smudge]ULF49335.1 hypothetical protein [Bacillus phage MrBubbles]
MGYMKIEQIKKDYPDEMAAKLFICKAANHYCVAVGDLFSPEDLEYLANCTAADFYDDTTETIAKYGQDAVFKYGLYNWKPF